MFVRNPYNYDVDDASIETGLHCTDPTRTMQDGAEETDINYIMNQFGITGVLPQGVRVPTYGDFDGIFDYQSAQNAMVEADRAFMQMPAEIRKRFSNDPQEFVEFCSNANNLDEMRRMGLAVPEAKPTVVPMAEAVKKAEEEARK